MTDLKENLPLLPKTTIQEPILPAKGRKPKSEVKRNGEEGILVLRLLRDPV